MNILPLSKSDKPVSICVVRLKTSIWLDERGAHIKKSLNFLKRKSSGYNILKEDSQMVGADEVLPRIVNIDSVADGIYEVTTCNESKDWETGYVDDYDYKLLPFNEVVE